MVAPMNRKNKMKRATSAALQRRLCTGPATKSKTGGVSRGGPGLTGQRQVDARHCFFCLHDFEQLARLESEKSREHVRRKDLLLGVVLRHQVIVILAREGDLILGGR